MQYQKLLLLTIFNTILSKPLLFNENNLLGVAKMFQGLSPLSKAPKTQSIQREEEVQPEQEEREERQERQEREAVRLIPNQNVRPEVERAIPREADQAEQAELPRVDGRLADPRVDPRINPGANPRIDPRINPRVNPISESPELNPNGPAPAQNAQAQNSPAAGQNGPLTIPAPDPANNFFLADE